MKDRTRPKNKVVRGWLQPITYLLLILLLALVLRLRFFVGLNWSDDPGYVYDAYRITEGTLGIPRYLPGMRIGMIYPIAFFFKLFGISNASATIYPLLCSLASIVLIYRLGSVMFDERTGLIAAFLSSFYPLDVITASWIMPDIPIAFFMGLSAYLFLDGDSSENRIIKVMTYWGDFKIKFRRKHVLFFFSGIATGIAYLIRSSGLMLILFVLFYMTYRTIRTRRIEWSYSLFFISVLGVILLEGAFHAYQSGDVNDFLLRYRVVTGFYHKGTAGINSDLRYFPSIMFNLDHTQHFNWKNRYFVHYGLFYYGIVLALIYVIIKWDRRVFPLFMWLTILFAYSEFGSMSLKEFVPIHKLHRHLTVLTIPAVTILAHVLKENLAYKRHLIRRGICLLVMSALFVTSIFYTYHEHSYLKASTYDVKAIYEFLKDGPPGPIYSDTGIGGHLNFYFEFQRHSLLRCLECTSSCDTIKDAYVIVNGSRGYGLDPEHSKRFDKCIHDPTNGWKHLKTVSGPDIDVFGLFNPEIYYAPP